ncbi:MAG: urea ABC transporter substrate-binding protein [Limisphaerales bacterium]
MIKRWVSVLLLAAALTGAAIYIQRTAHTAKPIKVGILHSMSGAMAISEKSMVDAELLAIEEINQKGGVLGRRIEAVIADGKSDWPTFAAQAERLITMDQVCTIFGCWTSASRKNVKPVVEKYDHLLVYPMAYEGLEQSPNIVYTGAAPNQQIIPAVKWSFDNIGKRFFLVGSDYVWPHSINAIIKDQLKALRAELVGEDYIFFGSDDVQEAVSRIKQAQPDVIFSSVVGDSNIPFYRELRAAGIKPEKTPVISVSIGEDELRKLSGKDLVGNYAAWNYFQSIHRPENEAFVQRFKAKYGQDRVTSDVIEAAYFSVYLWAQAASECGNDDVRNLRKAMLTQSLNAPEGVVSVDPETQHTWRSFSIGKIRLDGQLDLVWSAQKAIRPVPYPISRSQSEWDAFLLELYNGWGGKWANPVKH